MSLTIAVGGLFVGVLIGLVGVGGGSLVTPILVLLGIPVPTAVGTDLVYATGTKLIGAMQHWRQHSVDLHWVTMLCAGGVPGAILGSMLGTVVWARLPGGTHVLKEILGSALVIAALATALQEWLRQKKPRQERPTEPATDPSWRLVAPVGALIGGLLGASSVGGGSLIAPIMLLAGVAPRRVVGTDISSALLMTAAAGTIHMVAGTVNYQLAFNLMLGSIPGVLIGSRWTVRVPGKPLKVLVSSLVLLSGLRLMV